MTAVGDCWKGQDLKRNYRLWLFLTLLISCYQTSQMSRWLKNPWKSQFPVAGRPGLLFVLLVWKRNAKQLLLRLFVSKQTKDNKNPKPKQKTTITTTTTNNKIPTALANVGHSNLVLLRSIQKKILPVLHKKCCHGIVELNLNDHIHIKL